MNGSNQTVAGLKLGLGKTIEALSYRSNQTVAGLKQQSQILREDIRSCVQIRPLRD